MPKNACRSRIARVVLVIMLLATVTFTWFSPEATATTAVTINPSTGTVGTRVSVNGTIDTPDGAYVIRWNQTLNVTSGFAVAYNVNASFIVPQTVGNSTGRSVSVELIDNATGNIAVATFTLHTAYYIKTLIPTPPNQLQEGATTSILVNVTGGVANTVYVANVTVKDPANLTSWSLVSLTNTTQTGYGEGSRQYPADFGGAHTNYTGTYRVAFNETLANATFFVGLTDATEYKRFDVVNIRAMNYTAQPQELVLVDVKIGGSVVFSENVSAVGGVVESSWWIPGNAMIGTYTVTVSNSTTLGTIKSVPDVQTFEVIRALSSLGVKVENANRQPIVGVTVEVYNVTRVGSRTTSLDGRVNFSLDVGNYTVKSLVYNLLFNTTFVDVPSTLQPNITIVCPTYNLFVHVLDSKNNPSEGVTVSAYEWTSGVTQPAHSDVTDAEGNATLPLTFGRYRLRAYKDSVLLNETTIDLTNNTLTTVNCGIYNVDLSVFVTDYFGQPIPNAVVKFERKADGDYVEAYSVATGAGGSAIFNGIIGGNARISVYVAGKLSQTGYLYLDSSRERADFRIDGYVVVGVFLLEASQFFTLAVVLVVIALFLIILKYKSALRFFGRRKKTP